MSLKKKCLILWSALICATALPISATEVTDNPFAKPTSSQQPSAPKPQDPPYPYGYTKAELNSVPRIEVSGYKNPELIPEYMAWSWFFKNMIRINTDNPDNPDNLWYVFQRRMPSITREHMDKFIIIAAAALDEEQLVKEERIDERVFCDIVKNAVKKGQKLTNTQIKKMIHDDEQKLPLFFERVKAKIRTELSLQTLIELEGYMNKHVRVGMSLNKLDVEGWANLRKHEYSYSDVYEGILCRGFTQ